MRDSISLTLNSQCHLHISIYISRISKRHWGDRDLISGPPTLKSDALPTELWRIAKGGTQKFIMPFAYKYIYISRISKKRVARAQKRNARAQPRWADARAHARAHWPG